MATNIKPELSQEQLRSILIARNKGSSGWLKVLPLEEEDYVLNKEEFRDTVALRYSKSIPSLQSFCPSGKPFNPPHTMDCKKGGFVHSGHDDIRNLEPSLLSEVCKDVSVEPVLQTLTGEVFDLKSTNTVDEARLDVKAKGFYRSGQ